MAGMLRAFAGELVIVVGDGIIGEEIVEFVRVLLLSLPLRATRR